MENKQSRSKPRPSKPVQAESPLTESDAGHDIANPGVNPVVDHTTPDASLPFPVVAVGASAGGIEAFSALLKALPADTGMAFVIIQHLAPKHASMLPEILGRMSRMPVVEAKDDIPVEPDRVYVIPPGYLLAFGLGKLKLLPRPGGRGHARPVDHFMRSLAEEHGHKAIGVVLSGTANDGTLGLQEIKAAGGITFAQDSTAEQQGMPRSAAASGAVDFVLSPEDIANELVRIARHPYVAGDEADAGLGPAFGRILEVLRARTGVDFSNYKRNTLRRRITRRMVLHKLHSYEDYLQMLMARRAEVEALYRDVLIGVTSFFRNPEAYEALKAEVFPRITEGRDPHAALRIWALGCSTGEEAYSLAISYAEYAEAAGRHQPLQIFATDLNGEGIEKARSGLYPPGITQDVSAERLRRYFVEVDGNYQITKQIRDMCVFARQNVLGDPPFSRLDLVACRNMLIYMEPVLQQRLIPLLHYALREGGFLWLGGSETVGTRRDLFELLDARHKIYAKRARNRVPDLHIPITVDPPTPPQLRPPMPSDARGFDPQREADRILLARYAPAGVVINEEFDILQFRGDTSPFLMPAPGKASLSLFKMLREGLLVAVRGAIHRSRREGVTVREEGLRVRSNGGWRELDAVVAPLKAGGKDAGYLVLFEEGPQRVEARARQLDAETRAAADAAPPQADAAREIARLKQELSATREYLQSVIEQQQAANEELQAANEEVQSANEELQSINEELETSKEEIQSANEELATVNDELHARNLELSQSNNDFANLLSSVHMAIIMLGADLRIRRFTPAAEKLFNLIGSDIGRSLTDLRPALEGVDLEVLALEVIESMRVAEQQVRAADGRWYLLRVRPYRTQENRIEGVVVLLIDIDRMKAQET